jgi:hypothetical protein
MGGGPSAPDDSAAKAAQAKAEADAKAQNDKLLQQQAEEEDAIRRGLRGTKSLLSSAGQLGFQPKLGG